jgi:MFS family permease
MTMLVLWGAFNLMALSALLVCGKLGRRGTGRRKKLIYAQVVLATLVLATAFWMSCNTSIYTNVIQPSTVNGTPTGNYVITIQGAFTGTTAITNGTSTTVTRITTVNLTVE